MAGIRRGNAWSCAGNGAEWPGSGEGVEYAPRRRHLLSRSFRQVVGPDLSIHHWEIEKMTRLKKLKLMLAVMIGMGAATAVAAETMVEDTDGDGVYSMAELLVAYPAMTDERFVEIDTNADGAVDTDELAAAQEAGLLAAG